MPLTPKPPTWEHLTVIIDRYVMTTWLQWGSPVISFRMLDPHTRVLKHDDARLYLLLRSTTKRWWKRSMCMLQQYAMRITSDTVYTTYEMWTQVGEAWHLVDVPGLGDTTGVEFHRRIHKVYNAPDLSFVELLFTTYVTYSLHYLQLKPQRRLRTTTHSEVEGVTLTRLNKPPDSDVVTQWRAFYLRWPAAKERYVRETKRLKALFDSYREGKHTRIGGRVWVNKAHTISAP